MIFGIAIFSPFFLGVIEEDRKESSFEKRKLSNLPETPKTISDIIRFPNAFNSYYTDHFGLREWFTKYYRIAKYSIGDSPSQDVTIGQDGWLFLGGITKGYTKNGDPIGDARNVTLYSRADLKKLAEHMMNVKSWLNRKGIEYIFVIAPNKHTIYADKLPSYISKVNEESATDQAVKYLKEYTDIAVVDLRDSLIKEKKKHQLYAKIGTHWNHYGANIAQYEIIKEIQKLFPNQIKAELAPLKISNQNISDRGLTKMMGLHLLEETNPQPVFEQSCIPKKIIHDPNGRQIYTMICEDQQLNTIIFRDSFFLALEPYFSRKFKHSTYIWQRLNYPSLAQYIELEKPDIVIEEWVERTFPYVPGTHAGFL